MTGRTLLADWVDAHDEPGIKPGFWSKAAITFCAWARADPDLSRRLRGADTAELKRRFADLLALVATDGATPWAVTRARDLHDAARHAGVPTVTTDTYLRMLDTLTAALRDHGVPRPIVEEHRAVLEDIGPQVVGDWAAALHPWLRPRPGQRQLRDTAARLNTAHG